MIGDKWPRPPRQVPPPTGGRALPTGARRRHGARGSRVVLELPLQRVASSCRSHDRHCPRAGRRRRPGHVDYRCVGRSVPGAEPGAFPLGSVGTCGTRIPRCSPTWRSWALRARSSSTTSSSPAHWSRSRSRRFPSSRGSSVCARPWEPCPCRRCTKAAGVPTIVASLKAGGQAISATATPPPLSAAQRATVFACPQKSGAFAAGPTSSGSGEPGSGGGGGFRVRVGGATNPASACLPAAQPACIVQGPAGGRGAKRALLPVRRLRRLSRSDAGVRQPSARRSTATAEPAVPFATVFISVAASTTSRWSTNCRRFEIATPMDTETIGSCRTLP